MLGRKVHLLGCALHFNELPLRGMVEHLDGGTVSGTQWSGPIGSLLGKSLIGMTVVKFNPIVTDMDEISDEVAGDLSTDQSIFLSYIKAVSSGQLDDNIACRQVGPLCHARWLTCAIRILSLYCRTQAPSDVLVILVTFIQLVYGKYWFKYKKQSNFIPGPQILLEYIEDCKKVDSMFPGRGIWDQNKKVIQRNAFCLYGENFLASLLYSTDPEHRDKAVTLILAIRDKGNVEITPVRVPEINFDAETWDQLVDTESFLTDSHSPPCLKTLSNDDLEAMRIFPGIPPDFPIHSQSVERAVKLTTAAVQKAYSWDQQHSIILATMKSRRTRKRFRSKKHYKIIE
jgi:hypothetical protein